MSSMFLLLCAVFSQVPDHEPPTELIAGTYNLSWGDTSCGPDYVMVLCPGGAYRCRNSHTTWVGTWTWDKKKRLLKVSEKIAGSNDPAPIEWQADLRKGVLNPGGKALKGWATYQGSKVRTGMKRTGTHGQDL